MILVSKISMSEEIYQNTFQQSETLILMKVIAQCQKCISNEYLCLNHSDLIKKSIIRDVNNWIKDKKF